MVGESLDEGGLRMTEKLKLCPFCGYEMPRVWGNYTLTGFTGLDEPVKRHRRYVRCSKCYARGGVASGLIITDRCDVSLPLPKWATTLDALDKRAIETWNRRVSDGLDKDE